jgi:small redox-active disulfide protein 2
MVDIKVLGTGCAGCLKMERVVCEALMELGILDATVEFITDQRMIEYGLHADHAPGLLIDGYLAWAGSVPSKEQVSEWLQRAVTGTII